MALIHGSRSQNYDIVRAMLDHLRLIILLVASWINRDQPKISDYLIEEIRVYQKLYRGHRRRRLSVKALGCKTLDGFAGIVTPDTLLRWFSSLVVRKYDGSF